MLYGKQFTTREPVTIKDNAYKQKDINTQLSTGLLNFSSAFLLNYFFNNFNM
jgi:hypothetical protein